MAPASGSANVWADHACTGTGPIPPRLYRLDARTGLRTDVSDSLLRFVALRRSAAEPVFHVFAAGRDFSGAAFSFSGRSFVCAGHGKTVGEESFSGADCQAHDSAGRGDFRLRTTLPAAGVRPRNGMVAVDGPAAGGHPEHDWPVDDADGRSVLAGVIGGGQDREQFEDQARDGGGIVTHGSADFAVDATAVDHVASALAALAARVLYRRSAQSGRAAVMAVSDFSLERVRLRRAGRGLRAAESVGPRAPGARLPCGWGRWGCIGRVGAVGECATVACLCGLRFLAYQPRVFSHPAGHADGDSFSELRVVQMGCRAVGIQSADSVGASFAAGLLGAHGICLWTAFPSAQAWGGDWWGDGGAGGDFPGDGGAGRVAYAEQEAWSSCALQNVRKPL